MTFHTTFTNNINHVLIVGKPLDPFTFNITFLTEKNNTFFTAVSSFHVELSNCSLSDHIPWVILSGFSTIYPPYPVELASLYTIVLEETSVVNLQTLMSLKLFFQKEICSILSSDKVIKLFHVSADKFSTLKYYVIM